MEDSKTNVAIDAALDGMLTNLLLTNTQIQSMQSAKEAQIQLILTTAINSNDKGILNKVKKYFKKHGL